MAVKSTAHNKESYCCIGCKRKIMELNYTLIRSKRKTVSIFIDREGKINVKAPLKTSLSYIENFIKTKNKWINKKIEQQRINSDIKKQFDNKFMLNGKTYEIMFENVNSVRFCNENAVIFPKEYENRHILSYLCEKTYVYCKNPMELYSKLINEEYKNLKISNSKVYWGICNYKKEIKLNCRVIMLPDELINYIVIHELCHLVYLNHSANFWKFVEGFLPEYKKLRKQLKSYSYILQLYR